VTWWVILRFVDQNEAPVLDALADYHRLERYGFTPPEHRQGRGTDERVLAVLGRTPSAATCWPVVVSMTGCREAKCSRAPRN
jgi:hypothetical protein